MCWPGGILDEYEAMIRDGLDPGGAEQILARRHNLAPDITPAALDTRRVREVLDEQRAVREEAAQ
jgi:hypothetical protein